MCLYPKIIANKKYTSTKKNGGNIPAIRDERVKYVSVGCGNCMECRKQATRGWQVRLSEEIRENKNGIFVTLTFSDESFTKLAKEIDAEGYELDNQVATLATRRFLERWRKKHKKSVRHWLVTELGHNGTENIHMHGIIWTDKDHTEIAKHWQYGYVWTGNEKNGIRENYVSEKTVNYIVKYINKVDEKHKEYKSKVLTSAGIGSGYAKTEDFKRNKYNGKDTREYYKTKDGRKLALPIYYRNKIYTEEERERLWIEKLNKEERFVGGERIDISKDDKEYFATLEYYRKQNKRLGYKDGSKDWDRKRYENQKRRLKHKIREERVEEKQSAITWGMDKRS